jgi:DNA segregation ATPase FtsK/SpoIIIE-like protein
MISSLGRNYSQLKYLEKFMHKVERVMKKHEQQEPLITSVREWVIQKQLTKVTLSDVSISKIQRQFRIGYNRASGILEMLEVEINTKIVNIDDPYK